MKNRLKVATSFIACVFCCLFFSTAYSQVDTLEINKDANGVIRFARFAPDYSGKKKLSDAKSFLKQLFKTTEETQFELEKTSYDELGMQHQFTSNFIKE